MVLHVMARGIQGQQMALHAPRHHRLPRDFIREWARTWGCTYWTWGCACICACICIGACVGRGSQAWGFGFRVSSQQPMFGASGFEFRVSAAVCGGGFSSS